MPDVRKTLMGNGEWWSFECERCERYVAWQHSSLDGKTSVEKQVVCPNCEKRQSLQLQQSDR